MPENATLTTVEKKAMHSIRDFLKIAYDNAQSQADHANPKDREALNFIHHLLLCQHNMIEKYCPIEKQPPSPI